VTSIVGASITIRLPWPPACLSPNAKRRKHWSSYIGTAKEYRNTCFWLAREAVGRRIFSAPPQVEIAFFPPDARHRDDDNTIGAFKHGRDGIAEAIRHDDASWRPAYTFHAPHRPDGLVVVVLTAQGK
jgi:crossover junction endodeoxyribonuclease RusA